MFKQFKLITLFLLISTSTYAVSPFGATPSQAQEKINRTIRRIDLSSLEGYYFLRNALSYLLGESEPEHHVEYYMLREPGRYEQLKKMDRIAIRLLSRAKGLSITKAEINKNPDDARLAALTRDLQSDQIPLLDLFALDRPDFLECYSLLNRPNSLRELIPYYAGQFAGLPKENRLRLLDLIRNLAIVNPNMLPVLLTELQRHSNGFLTPNRNSAHAEEERLMEAMLIEELIGMHEYSGGHSRMSRAAYVASFDLLSANGLPIDHDESTEVEEIIREIKHWLLIEKNRSAKTNDLIARIDGLITRLQRQDVMPTAAQLADPDFILDHYERMIARLRLAQEIGISEPVAIRGENITGHYAELVPILMDAIKKGNILLLRRAFKVAETLSYPDTEARHIDDGRPLKDPLTLKDFILNLGRSISIDRAQQPHDGFIGYDEIENINIRHPALLVYAMGSQAPSASTIELFRDCSDWYFKNPDSRFALFSLLQLALTLNADAFIPLVEAAAHTDAKITESVLNVNIGNIASRVIADHLGTKIDDIVRPVKLLDLVANARLDSDDNEKRTSIDAMDADLLTDRIMLTIIAHGGKSRATVYSQPLIVERFGTTLGHLRDVQSYRRLSVVEADVMRQIRQVLPACSTDPMALQRRFSSFLSAPLIRI